MNITILILILIIIFVHVVISRYLQPELFDSGVSSSSQTQCGTICSKTLGCAGFAYDIDNNICYLSKNKIDDSPIKKEAPKSNQVFAQFYKNTMPRCNKLYVIDDSLYNSNNNLIRNITYTCKDSESGNEYNKIYNISEKKIDDITNLNKLKFDPYTFVEIDWNKMIDLNKNLHLVTNPTKSNSTLVMKEYDDEYLGQYLYPHKCVSGIKQKDCLSQCLNNKECVGTDWNPMILTQIGNENKYTIEKNVCCPKRIIKEKRKRTSKNESGHFYLKEYIYGKLNGNNNGAVFV